MTFLFSLSPNTPEGISPLYISGYLHCRNCSMGARCHYNKLSDSSIYAQPVPGRPAAFWISEPVGPAIVCTNDTLESLYLKDRVLMTNQIEDFNGEDWNFNTNFVDVVLNIPANSPLINNQVLLIFDVEGLATECEISVYINATHSDDFIVQPSTRRAYAVLMTIPDEGPYDQYISIHLVPKKYKSQFFFYKAEVHKSD